MFYQILLEFAYISEMKKREALRKKKKRFNIFCWDDSLESDRVIKCCLCFLGKWGRHSNLPFPLHLLHLATVSALLISFSHISVLLCTRCNKTKIG